MRAPSSCVSGQKNHNRIATKARDKIRRAKQSLLGDLGNDLQTQIPLAMTVTLVVRMERVNIPVTRDSKQLSAGVQDATQSQCDHRNRSDSESLTNHLYASGHLSGGTSSISWYVPLPENPVIDWRPRDLGLLQQHTDQTLKVRNRWRRQLRFYAAASAYASGSVPRQMCAICVAKAKSAIWT